MLRIHLRDLWLWWPEAQEAVLRGVTLTLEGPGLTVISGAAGSGKSTLLRLLAGIIPRYQRARIRGEVALTAAPQDPPGATLLLQHPETQLAAFFWTQEVTGSQPPGLPLKRLSRGELQKVALDWVLRTARSVVLLDEPFANLDGQATARLVAWLQRERHRRRILLVTHTSPRGCAPDDTLWMHQGRLEPASLEDLQARRQLRVPPERFAGPVSRPVFHPPRLQVQALRIRRGDRWLLRDGRFQMAPGEVVLLTGPNGAGKTTLARWLVGLEPASGMLFWDGRPRAHLRGYALLVPQQPERLLWGATPGETLAHLGGGQPLDPSLPESLWTRASVLLSGGEAQIAALALAFSRNPPVLLLDEPTHALDAQNLERLHQWLHNYRNRGGMAVVITHHPYLFADLATRWYHLEEARLEERFA